LLFFGCCCCCCCPPPLPVSERGDTPLTPFAAGDCCPPPSMGMVLHGAAAAHQSASHGRNRHLPKKIQQSMQCAGPNPARYQQQHPDTHWLPSTNRHKIFSRYVMSALNTIAGCRPVQQAAAAAAASLALTGSTVGGRLVLTGSTVGGSTAGRTWASA
jgi:hypothetical protein